jgi:aspartyl-tRNA synthetase
VKAISVTGGVTKISATRLKKGDVYQQALKSGAKSLPYLKVLEGGELSTPPPMSLQGRVCSVHKIPKYFF